ncbi:MAG: hypothetical protein MJZ37_00840 [Bacilli bacterium]|nr:hypothetical protein [Bacilli bacterium]
MELLSDYFHIYTDDNGIITDLKPDIENGHNPELKNLITEDYVKLYIEECVQYFCKSNHISHFWWKKFGCIESFFSWHNMTYNFVITFRKKHMAIQFSKNYIDIDRFTPLSMILRK